MTKLEKLSSVLDGASEEWVVKGPGGYFLKYKKGDFYSNDQWEFTDQLGRAAKFTLQKAVWVKAQHFITGQGYADIINSVTLKKPSGADYD